MAATWRSLAVAVLIALPACAPKPIVDPVSVMTDRSVPFSKRRTATEQARLANPDDPRRIKALHHVLWERGYPSWQRTNAVDELATHDETAFRDALRRRMILLRDRETLEHIFDLADEGGWTDLAPAIVRCYARRSVVVKDDERVERAAIERLHPDRSVEQVIFDVFSGVETGGAPVEVTANWKSMVRRERIAAWTLLARLVDAQELGTSLDRATTNDTLVSDMQAARRDLDIVPVQREGILRLQSLREPAQQAFWDRSVAVVSALRTDQRAGLDLRHLPLLVAGGGPDLEADRATLLARCLARDASAEHHRISPTHDGALRDWPQRLRHWQDRLCWADLVTILWLYRALDDVALQRQLFAQADRDLVDKTTEHGGVLRREADRFAAVRHEPLFRDHDLKFVPSPKMIERLYTGFAHYHFHAQRHRNRSFAGPGDGDLRMAERLGATCIVVTFIDRDRLSVDYYAPGRIVVDLDTIRRTPLAH